MNETLFDVWFCILAAGLFTSLGLTLHPTDRTRAVRVLDDCLAVLLITGLIILGARGELG